MIELKAGMLDSHAVTQALDYASSLAMLNADEVCQVLCNQFPDEKDFRRKVGKHFDNQEAFRARVRKQVENQGENREIALMLVGTGIYPGVERMSAFLGRYGFPIEIVNFEVFMPDNGPQLLVREVTEESNQPPRPTPQTTRGGCCCTPNRFAMPRTQGRESCLSIGKWTRSRNSTEWIGSKLRKDLAS